MSGVRMNKVVRFSAVTGFLISILLLLAISTGKKQVASPSTAHVLSNRPPVTVVGGSLYGDSLGPWLESSKCNGGRKVRKEYCADVSSNGGSSYILSSSSYNSQLNQTISTGWAIHFTDLKPNGTENFKQGILLCNYSPCNLRSIPSSADPNHIYITLKKHSIWDTGSDPSGGKLYHHDKSDTGCNDSSSGTGGKCDYPYNAWLFTAGGPATGTAYRCNWSQDAPCQIGVGNPPLTEQKSAR